MSWGKDWGKWISSMNQILNPGQLAWVSNALPHYTNQTPITLHNYLTGKKKLEVGYLSCRTFAWTVSDFYHSVELHPLICNPKFQQGINTGICMKVHNYCPTISPQCMNIFQSSINNTMNIAWVPPPFWNKYGTTNRKQPSSLKY